MTKALAFLLLVVPLFAGCTGSGGAFDVEQPEWMAGYAFAYRIDGEYHMDAREDGDRNQESGKIGPRVQVLEVLNTTLLGGKEPAYLVALGSGDLDTGADPPRLHVSLVGVRKDDLAFVQLNVMQGPSGSCSESVCANLLQAVSVARAPDSVYLDFPLTRGKSWAGVQAKLEDLDVDSFGDLEFRTTAKAVGRRTIDTPVGRVNAIQVDVVTQPLNLDEYLDGIRAEVKKEGGRMDALSLNFNLRTRLWYSPDHMAVVRSESVLTESARASGRDGDGKKFDFAVDANNRLTQVLSGAKLLARAERDLAYAGRLLFGQSPILDPSGLTPVPIDYSLDLVASADHVNAADGGNVTFQTKVLGIDKLPDGHRVDWRITDSEGNRTAQGQGLSFAYGFSQPGEYAVEVEARDARGNVTSSDGLVVVADYAKKLRVDCPDVTAFGIMGVCPTETVPVRVGIKRLLITATPVDGGPAPSPGFLGSHSLELFDDDEHRIARDSGASSAGLYSIEMTNFDGASAVDGRDWSMRLSMDRTAFEDAEYSINLYYSAKDAMPEKAKPRANNTAFEMFDRARTLAMP